MYKILINGDKNSLNTKESYNYTNLKLLYGHVYGTLLFLFKIYNKSGRRKFHIATEKFITNFHHCYD